MRSRADDPLVTLNEVKGAIPSMIPFAALRVTKMDSHSAPCLEAYDTVM
jgi:hypothetical protein